MDDCFGSAPEFTEFIEESRTDRVIANGDDESKGA